MGYTLYTDKDTKFECKIELQGASLKNAEARLIVEVEDMSLLFKGRILQDGKCVIPISKMNRFMDENTSGQIRLEVIADDTYFQPWSSAFTVDAARKLRVEVMTPTPTHNKPVAIVSFVNDPVEQLTKKIIRELSHRGITLQNIKTQRPVVKRCINEQIKKSGLIVDPASLVNSVVMRMANRR